MDLLCKRKGKTMCGRFTQKSERKVLEEEFFIQEFTDHMVVSYNVAPGQKAGIVINDGTVRYVQFFWGLVPSWAKDPKIGSRMINARGETVESKPSFKAPFRTRRCIVPADGFYEWQKRDKGKAPFYIYNSTGRPFGLAGLWDCWTKKGTQGKEDVDAGPLYTFTIITTQASPALSALHDRMPVIIPKDRIRQWLAAGERPNEPYAEGQESERLLVPYTGGDLSFHEVSRFVNSPGNNTPACIKPVSA
jgi:putative SOS response-associated peptidase YedK